MELPGQMRTKLIFVVCLLIFFSCENEKKHSTTLTNEAKANKTTTNTIEHPNFNEDSAYYFIQQQVDFGPRFPNNDAHTQCANFLLSKLKKVGLKAQIQKGKATTFNNEDITINNIIGSYKPELQKRILLFAHWDSRPFADQAKINRTKPILGANDGASGVGVLLEVARQLLIKQPKIGVDIIFFDAEDYGQPSSLMVQSNSESWCLGSRYWAKNPHTSNYKADFGILLDMVGNSNPVFTKERISMEYAPAIVQKVWNVAAHLNYQHIFINKETNFVGIDDHKPINEILGIPSIDIIHYEESTGNFHHSWHTHDDNLDIIDKSTLKIVGETILAVIYQEE